MVPQNKIIIKQKRSISKYTRQPQKAVHDEKLICNDQASLKISLNDALCHALSCFFLVVKMDFSKKPQNENHRKGANFISVLLMLWTVPLFWKGMKNGLNTNDLTKCLEEDKTDVLGDNLEAYVVEVKRFERCISKVIQKIFFFQKMERRIGTCY